MRNETRAFFTKNRAAQFLTDTTHNEKERARPCLHLEKNQRENFSRAAAAGDDEEEVKAKPLADV